MLLPRVTNPPPQLGRQFFKHNLYTYSKHLFYLSCFIFCYKKTEYQSFRKMKHRTLMFHFKFHVSLFVSVSAMLVYIHQKKYRSSFILERYFFVSIYPAAIPGTYLAVFLVAALLLCL